MKSRFTPEKAVSGQRSAVSGQRSAVSGQRSAVSGLVRFFLLGATCASLHAQTTGQLLLERWTGLPANPSVLTLQARGIAKRAPNVSGAATAAGSFGAVGDLVGVRLRGLLKPPVTGTYTLYVAGDDNTQLWISPDSSRFNKELVAWNHSWTAREQWDKYPTQRSLPLQLTAGQSYYVEALMQEQWGSQSLAVGWSFTPENFALASKGSTATQSGTKDTGFAWRAIDGNLNGAYDAGSVSLTNSALNTWWQVDFGQDRTINRVVLFNRNGYQTRVSNFRLSALNGSGSEIFGENFFTTSGNVGNSFVWDLPQTVSARRVKLQILGYNGDGNGYLNLAEVQASAFIKPPLNVALASQGATATQSNTYSTASASRAIDGNLNGDSTAGSVSQTGEGIDSWLQVDLGQDRPINRIVLHNRDSYQTRLSNFRITVKNAAGTELSAANFFTTSGNAGDSMLWNLPTTVTARKIKISFLGKNRDSNGYLSLAEVQAFLSTPQSDTHSLQTIPACYLAPPPPEPLDADNDNLPDAWETQNGLSASNAFAGHGEYGDPDNDGISNFDEHRYGSNPTVKDALADGLTRERWFDIVGGDAANLTSARSRFLNEPNERVHVPGIKESPLGENFGTRYRGFITVPVSGDYTFWIAGDDEAELWLADGSVAKANGASPVAMTNRYGKVRIARIKDERFGTDKTKEADFDSFASQRSRTCSLVRGASYYIEVLHKQSLDSAHVSVAWQGPGQPRSIIPASAFTSDIPEDDDLDDDYLPAAWETQYGLNSGDNGITDARDGQYGDWDADGLTNLDEYQLGTHPKEADTDNDGMTDKDERDYYHSNPLVSNLIGSELHKQIDFNFFHAGNLIWSLDQNGSLLTEKSRGWMEYSFNVSDQQEGVYEVEMLADVQGTATGNVEMPLDFMIDGADVGTRKLNAPVGSERSLKVMFGWLKAGDHLLRIQVANPKSYCYLRVNDIKINRLGGSDIDLDGIPDWYEVELNGNNRLVTAGNESKTSPACIEGITERFGFLKVSKETIGGTPLPVTTERGVDNGFYCNVELDPTLVTQVDFQFDNDALHEVRSVRWSVTNILETPVLTVRKDDSLRIAAWASGAVPNGTFSLTKDLIPIAASDGSLVHHSASPVIVKFDTAGQFVFHSSWTGSNGETVNGTLLVKVVGADFGEPLDVLTWNRRTWSLSGIGAEIAIEADSSLGWVETTPSGTQLRSFVVTSFDVGERRVLARVQETGAILAHGKIKGFSVIEVGRTADSKLDEVRDDGTYVYSFSIVQESMPTNAEVRLRTHFQGAVFPDGSRDLVLRSVDFDDYGTAVVRIEWADATSHRICHTMDVYVVQP